MHKAFRGGFRGRLESSAQARLHKMLESESRRRVRRFVQAQNLPRLDFQLVGTEELTGRGAYVLEVRPKRNEKNLFEAASG